MSVVAILIFVLVMFVAIALAFFALCLTQPYDTVFAVVVVAVTVTAICNIPQIIEKYNESVEAQR